MACLCSRAAQGCGGCMREVGRPRNRAAAQACRPGNAGKAPAQCGGGLRACPNLALAGVNTIRQPQGICRARSKVHQHCLQLAGLKAGLCSSESQPRCRAANYRTQQAASPHSGSRVIALSEVYSRKQPVPVKHIMYAQSVPYAVPQPELVNYWAEVTYAPGGLQPVSGDLQDLGHAQQVCTLYRLEHVKPTHRMTCVICQQDTHEPLHKSMFKE